MPNPEFSHLLQAFPDPCVVVTADLRVIKANDGFLVETGAHGTDISAQCVLDVVFPDPADPEVAEGRRLLRRSIAGVLESGRPHTSAVHRHDTQPGRRNKVRRRYWNVVTSAVGDGGGCAEYLLIRVQDVTANSGLLAAALAQAQTALHRGAPPAVDPQGLTASLLEAERRGQSNSELTAQVQALAEMLAARTMIEQAKGMLMATRRLTADEAYQELVTESQRLNIKLRDIAAHRVGVHSASLVEQRRFLLPDRMAERSVNPAPDNAA